ncbi:hypothetical protein VNO77_07394 [Canavalia gladiata]|uniref:Uncharacterized protein n=1 Tax=Canavalia gladiata TaxID=3824 RepID=A0AAN9R0K5_CANGL
MEATSSDIFCISDCATYPAICSPPAPIIITKSYPPPLPSLPHSLGCYSRKNQNCHAWGSKRRPGACELEYQPLNQTFFLEYVWSEFGLNVDDRVWDLIGTRKICGGWESNGELGRLGGYEPVLMAYDKAHNF